MYKINEACGIGVLITNHFNSKTENKSKINTCTTCIEKMHAILNGRELSELLHPDLILII